jgi:hypothetical protein
MKKGRFLWSAHRITEKQKAGKSPEYQGKTAIKEFQYGLKSARRAPQFSKR